MQILPNASQRRLEKRSLPLSFTKQKKVRISHNDKSAIPKINLNLRELKMN